MKHHQAPGSSSGARLMGWKWSCCVTFGEV